MWQNILLQKKIKKSKMWKGAFTPFFSKPFNMRLEGFEKINETPDVWDITDYSVMEENLYIQEGEELWDY